MTTREQHMNKKEIYYKFIFTNYNSLSRSTSGDSFVPTNDGVDQKGEVRALCNECPDHVITYDQLSSASPFSMYKNGINGWSSEKKNAILSYVNQWKDLPLYFNLRNYEDTVINQRLGMSLMISHSPEVGGDYGGWTKFKSTYDNKIIYCSLMVSTGDFFYNWCLPTEVIVKSGLRDRIVASRFHDNWYFTMSEKQAWKAAGLANVSVGQEKRIFCQAYFKEGYPYGYQSAAKFYVYYYNGDNKYLLSDTSCVGKDGITYTGTNRNFPPHSEISYYFLTSDPSVRLTRSERFTSSDVTKSGTKYVLKSNSSIEVSPIYTVELYTDISEDLKRDFIDLEVTRRILYYDDTGNSNTRLKYTNGISTNYVNIQPTRDIPKIVSGTYYDTNLSYEPPQVYINASPLQIKYNLLRYTLNDRPPFSDCETVLVMWVANSDPSAITDGNVAGLHALNWQQYAVPISVRCCFRGLEGSDHPYCTDRFLVNYPIYWDTTKIPRESSYKFHIRCAKEYQNGVFKEAVYLRDLVDYSQDYILTFGVYSGIDYSGVFDIQRYLLKKYRSSFKELYAKKTYVNLSMNQQQQAYYIRVKDNLYKINTINDSLKTYFVKSSNTNEELKLSDVLVRKDYEKWDFDDVTYQHIGNPPYGLNDFFIEDNRYIALFDAAFKIGSTSVFSEVTGNLTIVNGDALRSFLKSKLPSYTWDDIYISSLGFSNMHQTNGDSLLYSVHGCYHFPLGFLDNHLRIGNVTYGRTIKSSNNKVVVGFKKMFDYKYEDLYHFKYDYTLHNYISVTTEYNANTGNYDVTQRLVTCTAYIMNYID